VLLPERNQGKALIDPVRTALKGPAPVIACFSVAAIPQALLVFADQMVVSAR
jgi:hypothetical protein